MISTLLKVIQWKFLLYLAFVFFLFKYCFLYGYGFKTILSFFDLGILTSAILLLIASSYLLLFSLRKQIGKAKLFLLYSKKYTIIFGILGLLLGTYLSFKIEKPSYSLFFFICFFTIIFYSEKIKQKNFMSNILKPFLRSVVILLVCWFDFPVNISSTIQLDFFLKLQLTIALYVIVFFLSNIVREIIQDINTINYDNNNNNKTLPILLGRNRAKKITIVISIIAITIVLAVAFLYVKNTSIRMVIICLVTIPQLFSLYHLINSSTAQEYKFLSKILNIGFLLAFLSIPIISYFLKYVIH